MTSRINARIDADLARKVEILRARTGKSTSEIVKASIEAYFEEVSTSRPAELLRDFIGCAEGEETLSSEYKQALTEGWSTKAGL